MFIELAYSNLIKYILVGKMKQMIIVRIMVEMWDEDIQEMYMTYGGRAGLLMWEMVETKVGGIFN